MNYHTQIGQRAYIRGKFLVGALTLIALTAGCQTLAPEQSRTNKPANEVDDAMRLASSSLQGGRADQALRELRAVARANPDNADINNLMGLIQLSLRNTPRAIHHFTRAYMVDKSTGNGVNLSSALIENKNYRDSEKILLGLTRRKNDEYAYRERIYHNLGIVASNTKRPRTAEKWFRRALQENPTFYLSLFHYGNLLDSTGRKKEAMARWQTAATACAVCSDPVAAMTMQLVAAGDLARARQLISNFEKQENLPTNDAVRIRELKATVSQIAASNENQRRATQLVPRNSSQNSQSPTTNR